MYRQGDVYLIPASVIPPDAKPVPADEAGRVVLRHGEATGHHHSILGGAVLFRPDDMPAGWGGWLEVGPSGAVLEHQEHDPVALPPGIYRQMVQVEETAGFTRAVMD